MLKPRLLLAAFLATAAVAAPPPNPADIPPGNRNLIVHDPATPVFAEDSWWVFGTGRRILVAKSPDLIDWSILPPALSSLPPWSAEIAPGNKRSHFWAPDLVRIGGLWHLYYSVSEFGKNTSAIGLATSPTLDPSAPGHVWTDRGIAIRSGPGDHYNAIDPSVLAAADGRLWMAFGSFWGGLFLVELDPATGLRLAPDSPVHPLAYSAEIEAPTLYQRGEYYYLFFNEGLCCKGVASTYRILVGRSRSVTGPYLDDRGRDLRDGGGRDFLAAEGDAIGPGHAGLYRDSKGVEWLSFHFYDRTRQGIPYLGVRRLAWTDDAWPLIPDHPDPAASPAAR